MENTSPNFKKKRAGRNRTLELKAEDRVSLRSHLINIPQNGFLEPPMGTLQGDCVHLASLLPKSFVDLLILDPPITSPKISMVESFPSLRWVITQAGLTRLLYFFSSAKTDCLYLHLWRVVYLSIHFHGCCNALHRPQPDYLGARKGARSTPQLEERQRGHLVLHPIRRLHI